ncbi:MAG: ribosome silencing factor [Chitinophagales bacterium]|nr:ribosome silencing factor [Chitinophagales bacterium]
MATLSVSNLRKKGTVLRINRNSKVFKTIIRAIQDKKGEHIVSLDLRKVAEAAADFFIVCEATSTTQIKAIIDHVDNQMRLECAEAPYRQEGYKGMQWVLLDYVNIVVHVMHPESRKFYKLEEMWSDADLQEHNL